ASGKFIRSVGRRGAGPNEFGRNPFIYGGAADTIIVFDPANRRYHHLDRAGKFVRVDTAGDRNRLAWIYDRTIVERSPFGVEPSRLRAVIAGIPVGTNEIA